MQGNEETTFTEEDICEGISKLKANKALGNCNVSAEVLKVCKSQAFVAMLTKIFNFWS